MKLLFPFVFSLGFFIFSLFGFASACCGGGLTDTAIILGGEKAHVSASFSNSIFVIDHVDSRGIWYDKDENQVVETLSFDYTKKVSPIWQIGISAPVVTRTLKIESYSHLGDVGVFTGQDLTYDSPSSL